MDVPKVFIEHKEEGSEGKQKRYGLIEEKRPHKHQKVLLMKAYVLSRTVEGFFDGLIVGIKGIFRQGRKEKKGHKDKPNGLEKDKGVY